MFRRLSLASVVVWFGVLVVLGMAITIVVELNRATSESEQALHIAAVTGAYGAAHDAHSQQEVALDGDDMERTRSPRRRCERRSPARSRWTPVSARRVDRLLTQVSAYEAAVDAGRLSEANALASEIEAGISTPGMPRVCVRTSSASARTRASAASSSSAASGSPSAFVVFGALWWMLRQQRRRLDAARLQELSRLNEMASSDPLTGLRNHRVFHEDLARELQRTGRTGEPLALVLVDLDGLKTINDTHGHQVGDQRIKALADALLQSSRATDTAYRIGGDEFAVLLRALAGGARSSSLSVCASASRTRRWASPPRSPSSPATR